MSFEKLWPKWFNYLPASFVYYCAMRVWVESTSTPYDDTIVSDIKLSHAIQRFARIHGLPGHGEDEFYDSNRKTAYLKYP
jgi:hypothetical protein